MTECNTKFNCTLGERVASTETCVKAIKGDVKDMKAEIKTINDKIVKFYFAAFFAAGAGGAFGQPIVSSLLKLIGG